MRYPILDATVRGWAIASVCMRCFKHPDCNAENTTKLNRKRLECVGCGEPIFTPTNTKKGAWDCCSNRCYQRAYRKRRRQYGSTIAWKWAEGGRHECECCKKSIGGKRRTLVLF